MPRQGSRPYECVRRAWHSYLHHPIRGSLIQEIFRLANEVHNPATKKNKEWLEKLPLVVLKAEEIMYSKANSEAEYMDLKTLWERANDAIDIIIRRNDTAEEIEGELLQPCIEAVLNLGCIPRRASRSQRHINPECYLSSVNKRDLHLGSSVHILSSAQSSLSRLESWYSALVATNKLNHFGSEVNSVVPDGSFERKDSAPLSNCGVPIPFMESLLSCHDRGLSEPVGVYNCPNLGRVYPSYYSGENPHVTSELSLLKPQDPAGNTMHILPPVCEYNFVGSKSVQDILDSRLVFGEASENPTDSECDLSLRLGLFSPPSSASAWTHEVEDVGSNSSCNGNKYFDPFPGGTRALNSQSSFSSTKEKDKGFDFIPVDATDEPLESCSSKWRTEEEGNATGQGF